MIGTATSVINIKCEYPKTFTCIANYSTVVWPAWWFNPAMWEALDDTAENAIIVESGIIQSAITEIENGGGVHFRTVDEMMKWLDEDDAELDSPNCHQDAINELESRDFVRVNDPRILKG